MNAAIHIADARAEARCARMLIERVVGLVLAGQQPTQGDLQAALDVARITEFHAALAVRSLQGAGHLAITEETLPCL